MTSTAYLNLYCILPALCNERPLPGYLPDYLGDYGLRAHSNVSGLQLVCTTGSLRTCSLMGPFFCLFSRDKSLIPSIVIVPVPYRSGHAIAFQRRSPPRNGGVGHVVHKAARNGAAFSGITMAALYAASGSIPSNCRTDERSPRAQKPDA